MKKLFFILSILFFTHETWSAPLSNANNSGFYYEIGSARSISLPPNVNVTTIKLGGATEIGLGYSCGKFDPTLGLSNILNSLSNTGNNLINGAVGAVTSAIGSLPALILQRIDPGLYDLFQNALIRAEATLSLANKTCEQYEQDIRNGKNPYEEWTQLAKAIDWKVQMGAGTYGSSTTDVVQAKKKVETNNGEKGLPWIGGHRAGGKNQPPIKVTSDFVKAGYNITLNRSPDDTSTPSFNSGSAPPLVELWKKPDDAIKWAVDVLGDIDVYTYDNHPAESTPGHGLLVKVENKFNTVLQGLQSLVSGNTQPTINNLAAVSSSATLINRDIVESIQSLDPSEQAIAISKLASETAMSDTLERALTIRRLLLTGKREPNAYTAKVAQKEVDRLVSELNRDIDNIMFEHRIRKELTSSTASVLLKLKRAHKIRSSQTVSPAGSDSKIMEDGAIQ